MSDIECGVDWRLAFVPWIPKSFHKRFCWRTKTNGKNVCFVGSLPNNIHYSLFLNSNQIPFWIIQRWTPICPYMKGYFYCVENKPTFMTLTIFFFPISLLLFQIDLMGPHCSKLQHASPYLPWSRPTLLHVSNFLTLVFLNGLHLILSKLAFLFPLLFFNETSIISIVEKYCICIELNAWKNWTNACILNELNQQF
jgi:hypothetical protein